MVFFSIMNLLDVVRTFVTRKITMAVAAIAKEIVYT
jgi:GDP-D-mannose dehydratase